MEDELLERYQDIARKASSGPWEPDTGGHDDWPGGVYIRVARSYNGDTIWRAEYDDEDVNDEPGGTWEDAVFTSTFDPPTVLALLEQLREVKAERDALAILVDSIDSAIGDPAHPHWDSQAAERIAKIIRLIEDQNALDRVLDAYEAKRNDVLCVKPLNALSSRRRHWKSSSILLTVPEEFDRMKTTPREDSP